MNEKQRKRREKQTRHHTQDATHCAAFGEEKRGQTDESEEINSTRSNPRTNRWWQRLADGAARYSPLFMVLLTGALVYIGYVQTKIYYAVNCG
jgi:hypothetical protein